MITHLPDGAIIKLRDRGQASFWKVVPLTGTPPRGATYSANEKAYTAVGEQLKAGTVIHVCTWKRGGASELNVNRTYTLKQDCDWVPMIQREPDTDEATFKAMAHLAMIPVRIIVVDGHRVIYGSTVQPSVSVPGAFGWTWLGGPYAGASEFNLFADAVSYARTVLAQFHQESVSGGALTRCVVCDPPHRNVEKR